MLTSISSGRTEERRGTSKTSSKVNASPPVWIPREITFEAFESLFGLNPETASGVPVTSYLTNSVAVAFLAMALSVPIGTAAGYAFSRFDFVGSRSSCSCGTSDSSIPSTAWPSSTWH